MAWRGDRSSGRYWLGLTLSAAALAFGGSLIALGQSEPSVAPAGRGLADTFESRSVEQPEAAAVELPVVADHSVTIAPSGSEETEAPGGGTSSAPGEIRLASLDLRDPAQQQPAVSTLPVLPEIDRLASPGGPDVFGSLSLAASGMPLARQFKRAFVAKEWDKPRGCGSNDQSGCVAQLPPAWRRSVLLARALPVKDRIGWINRIVNRRIAYRDDMVAHGVPDLWSTPTETMATNSGDCEDYAILKLRLLALVGVAPSRMHVIVVRSSTLKDKHAVLAVREGEAMLILDNLTDAVRRDSQISAYTPMFALNGDGFWIHATRTGNAPAVATAPRTTVR